MSKPPDKIHDLSKLPSKLYNPAAAPHAHQTAWAYDAKHGFWVLVLEDEAGEPIAFATYTYDKWLWAFQNLMHEQEKADGRKLDGKH